MKKKALFILCSLILIACNKDEIADITHIQIIAHRGVTYQAPENGLIALTQSVDMGLDGVELDIQSTKDGEIVVFHDASLMERTGVSGAVYNYTIQEIKQMRLKDKRGVYTAESIPTLRETLKQIGGKIHCFIELKMYPSYTSPTLIKDFINILDECGIDSSMVTVISFHNKMLAQVHSFNKSIPLCLILFDDEQDVFLNSYSVDTESQSDYSHLTGVVLHRNLCKKNILEHFKKELEMDHIYIYDVSSLDNISAGNFQWINGIITDKPKECILYRAEHR